jgi:transcriptional regulator with XRE-family HTH domain
MRKLTILGHTTKMDEMTPAAPRGETIGQRLRRLRLEKGLSQRDLAEPGVSYAYISRIEAGTRQPSVKALRKLAAKIGVSPEYLETGSDIDDNEARELRIGDAELALRLGDAAAAETTLAELLVEADQVGDVTNANRARIALAFVHDQRGDNVFAIQLFEQAIEAERPSATERLDVYATLARAYVTVGAAQRAVDLLEDCLAEVRSLEAYDPALEVRYANVLSYALSDAGQLDRAEEVLREALDRARELQDDPFMRIRLYWSLARLSEMEGKPASALHHIRRAMALLEASEDTLHLARAHISSAVIMTTQHNADAALEQLDRAEQLLGSHASSEDVGMLKTERARALAAKGDGAGAVTFARDAISLLEFRNNAELGMAYCALGDGLSLQGEFDAADDAYGRAVDVLVEETRWRDAMQACQSWGKMLRKAGRDDAALDVLERGSELGLRLRPTITRDR